MVDFFSSSILPQKANIATQLSSHGGQVNTASDSSPVSAFLSDPTANDSLPGPPIVRSTDQGIIFGAVVVEITTRVI
jgi:hypothetical protein